MEYGEILKWVEMGWGNFEMGWGPAHEGAHFEADGPPPRNEILAAPLAATFTLGKIGEILEPF